MWVGGPRGAVPTPGRPRGRQDAGAGSGPACWGWERSPAVLTESPPPATPSAWRGGLQTPRPPKPLWGTAPCPPQPRVEQFWHAHRSLPFPGKGSPPRHPSLRTRGTPQNQTRACPPAPQLGGGGTHPAPTSGTPTSRGVAAAPCVEETAPGPGRRNEEGGACGAGSPPPCCLLLPEPGRPPAPNGGGTPCGHPRLLPVAPLTRIVLPAIHLVVHVHGQLLEEAVAELQRDEGGHINVRPGGWQALSPPPSLAPLPTHRLQLLLRRLGQLGEVQTVGCMGGGGHKLGVIPAFPHQNAPQMRPKYPRAWRGLRRAGRGAGRQARGRGARWHGASGTPPNLGAPRRAAPSAGGCSGGAPGAESRADNTSVPCTLGAPCAPEKAAEGRTG